MLIPKIKLFTTSYFMTLLHLNYISSENQFLTLNFSTEVDRFSQCDPFWSWYALLFLDNRNVVFVKSERALWEMLLNDSIVNNPY